jgi:hypothetical protein
VKALGTGRKCFKEKEISGAYQVDFESDRSCGQCNSCSDLRASISGRDIPEDVKSRLLALHEENVSLKESNKTAQDKLAKAKQVRKLALGGFK